MSTSHAIAIQGLPTGEAFAGQAREILRTVRRSPLAAFGILIVGVAIFIALAAPWLAPYDPLQVDFSRQLLPPSPTNLFGTDENGRDILSRTMYGVGISLQVAVVVLSIALSLGLVLGGAAGYIGGWVDDALMRVTDMFLAFPALVLALVIAAALGPSLTNAMAAVAVVWWPWYARLIRGQILSVKELLYVDSARAVGCGPFRILLRHMLPNCISPVLVMASLDVGFTILTTAGLSFVGLGAQSPSPELGSMIGRGRLYALDHWWVPMFPGLAIFVLILGVNLLGDAVRDIMDPRFRRLARG